MRNIVLIGMPGCGKSTCGVRNIVSLATYTLAACLGGFCPIAAFIIVAAVSLWWVFPAKKKAEEPQTDAEEEDPAE